MAAPHLAAQSPSAESSSSGSFPIYCRLYLRFVLLSYPCFLTQFSSFLPSLSFLLIDDRNFDFINVLRRHILHCEK